MTIEHKNKAYEFLYYDDENCWVAQKRIDIGEHNLFMEIYLKDFQTPEFDWQILSSFLEYLEDRLIKELDPHARELLSAVSKINHWTDTQDLAKYRFGVEGIIYKEPRLPVFSHQKTELNYSLVYKLYHSDYVEAFDPYTNYMVDFKNMMITGCKKE